MKDSAASVSSFADSAGRSINGLSSSVGGAQSGFRGLGRRLSNQLSDGFTSNVESGARSGVRRFASNVSAAAATQFRRFTEAGRNMARRVSDGFRNALRTGLAAAGRVAVGALAAVAAGGVALGVSSIKAASDLDEALSKNIAVFGDYASSVVSFSEDAARSIGLSQTEAVGFASSFGNLLQQIGGQTQEESAQISQSLTTLAADLGSFNNVSGAEAAQALSSALTGEFEPLKRFGVIINDNVLKVKALELGLYDGSGALSAQAKQAATLALIYEQTETAQGDFARTSGGLANQQRILSAQFANLKTEIGSRLLPVAVRLVTWANDQMPRAIAFVEKAFDKVGPVIETVADAISGLFTSSGDGPSTVTRIVTPILDGFGSVVSWFRTNWPQIRTIISGVFNAVSTFVTTVLPPIRNTVLNVLGAVVGWIAENMPAIQATVTRVFEAVSTWLNENWPPIQALVLDVFQTISTWIAENWPAISETFIGVVTAMGDAFSATIELISAIWDRWGEDFLKIAELVLGIIGPLWTGAWEVIAGAIRTATAVINGDWDKAWDEIKGIFSTVWDTIKTIASNVLGDLIGTIRDKLTEIAVYFYNLPGVLLNALGDLSSLLVDVGKDIINGLLDGMRSAWDSVSSFISDRAGSISGTFKSVLGIASPSRVMMAIGSDTIAGFNQGMQDRWPDAEAFLLGVPSSISSSLTNASPEVSAAADQITENLRARLIAAGSIARDLPLGEELLATIQNAVKQVGPGSAGLAEALEAELDKLKVTAQNADLGPGLADSFASGVSLLENEIAKFDAEFRVSTEQLEAIAAESNLGASLAGSVSDSTPDLFAAFGDIESSLRGSVEGFGDIALNAEIGAGLAESLSGSTGDVDIAASAIAAAIEDALTFETVDGTLTSVLDRVTEVAAEIPPLFAQAWNLVQTSTQAAGGRLQGVLVASGRAVIQGFQRGLESQWAQTEAWLSSRGDRIQQLKGPIAVDRVLLTPQGDAIIDGFEVGMRARWSDTETFLASIGPSISDAIPSSALFFDAGFNLVSAVADGLSAGAARVESAAARISGALSEEFVNNATPGTEDFDIEAQFGRIAADLLPQLGAQFQPGLIDENAFLRQQFEELLGRPLDGSELIQIRAQFQPLIDSGAFEQFRREQLEQELRAFGASALGNLPNAIQGNLQGGVFNDITGGASRLNFDQLERRDAIRAELAAAQAERSEARAQADRERNEREYLAALRLANPDRPPIVIENVTPAPGSTVADELAYLAERAI